MFSNQFQIAKDVIKESKTIEDVVDPVYPIVLLHPIPPKMV